MKKLLLIISVFSISFLANAQVSKFEGASATVALAYQNISTDDINIVTGAGAVNTGLSSASKGVVGKVGLDYTWNLSDGKFLAAGLDYALNGGGTGDVDFQSQGVSVGTEVMKWKQKAKIFVAPSMLISQNTLGYIKLGYAQYQSKSMFDGKKDTFSGITYGVGAKLMSSEKGYFFAEANILSGRSKTFVENGSTITIKPKGSEILFGYGAKF